MQKRNLKGYSKSDFGIGMRSKLQENIRRTWKERNRKGINFLPSAWTWIGRYSPHKESTSLAPKQATDWLRVQTKM